MLDAVSDDYWSRLDRDRDLWRAHDAQYDRDVAYRDRVEADEYGRRALVQGNTAEALRAVAGPDAALYYLESMSDIDEEYADEVQDEEDFEEEWPPHFYAFDPESLAENINELPYHADIRVRFEDDEDDDDVRIEAVNRYQEGEVLGSCKAEWSTVVRYLARATELARTEHAKAIVHTLRRAMEPGAR